MIQRGQTRATLVLAQVQALIWVEAVQIPAVPADQHQRRASANLSNNICLKFFLKKQIDVIFKLPVKIANESNYRVFAIC